MAVHLVIFLPKMPCNTPHVYLWFWPTLYTYTVYGRTFGDFPAKITVYTPHVYLWFWPTLYTYTVYGRTFGDVPAKMLCIHRMFMVVANPIFIFDAMLG